MPSRLIMGRQGHLRPVTYAGQYLDVYGMAPSGWGQRVTRSPDWQLRLDGEQLALLIDGRQYHLHVANEHSVRVVRGVLWSRSN